MAPGSSFHHISFRSTILVSYLLSLQSFTFRSINQKYQKHYFTVYPSISDLTLQITVKGLTTPLSRWVQVGVCLCRYSVTCALSLTRLIPWFSKTKGNTYATLLHHPFLFKGKPTHAQEVARRISGAVAGEICAKSSQDLISRQLAISGAVAGEIYAQVKTYQVPIINSSPSHYIICHSPLVFLSPTSKMIFENLCLFFAPLLFVSFHLLLVCFCVGLIVCHDGSR